MHETTKAESATARRNVPRRARASAWLWLGCLASMVACVTEATDEETPNEASHSALEGEASLWNDTAIPRSKSDPDSTPIEIGVRFQADVDGEITGIHYYKSRANTGVHTAHLWSRDGALLASATFGKETASGWQAVRFATPVKVKAKTTYIASYHTDTGHYAGDNGFFTGKGVDQGTLHALADGQDGGNGVYRYGATAFPDQTWRGSNYWVDVYFKPTNSDAGAPSTDGGVGPVADASNPSDGSTGPGPGPGPGGCPAAKRIITAQDVAQQLNSGYPAGTAVFVPDGPDPWGGCFPGPKTTGIPAGTTLSAYTGSCEVRTANTVLDGKLIDKCYTLKINASNVTIKNSKFVGANIDVVSGNLTISDSEADFGPDRDGQGFTGSNIAAKRLNFYGGHRQVWCSDCVVEDSYFHDQNISKDPQAHASAMRTESGTVYRHNTVLCNAKSTAEGGGCSANQTGYPDFGPIHHNTVEKNFFLAPTDAGYCAYGGWNPGKPYNDNPQNATYIKFLNNVMQRGTRPNDIRDFQFPKTSRHRYTCGFWGATTSYRPDRTGSAFTGNMWDDGLLWDNDKESPYWPFHE